MTATVWIVEMFIGTRWEPTVAVQFNRSGGRKALAEWRKRLPHDVFRLRKYIREDDDE